MKQINMVPCIRCNEVYAMEDSDGICDECMPKIEIEMAVADMWVSLTVFTSRDPKYLAPVKDSIRIIAKQLTELVEKI